MRLQQGRSDALHMPGHAMAQPVQLFPAEKGPNLISLGGKRHRIPHFANRPIGPATMADPAIHEKGSQLLPIAPASITICN